MIAHKNEDVLITLSYPPNNTQGCRANVNIGSKRWVKVASLTSRTKGFLDITMTGLEEQRSSKGFRFLSILDDQDTILSLNLISKKSRSITAVIQENRVLRDGCFVFKILLTSSSTTKDPKPRETYLKASSAIHALSLMEADVTLGGPHTASTLPALVDQILETNVAMASIDKIEGHNELTVLVPPDLTSEAACDHDSLLPSYSPAVEPLSNATVVEVLPDVHFYHFDQVNGASIFKAHLANLNKYPGLLLYANKSRVAKEELMTHMASLTPCTSQTPVVVDVSCFAFLAFKNLIECAYTQDPEGTLHTSSTRISDLNASHKGPQSIDENSSEDDTEQLKVHE
ncbi:hypothetical protein EC957_010715 [Mortierella hygrophila]|uniref:Uncharacterized protein n=1 Tax=Mortierella hygrophila TaxID=979708 RepID=A0A9P6EWE4_9FUNG|nr:hypothetical protein EC957_010715 [Mortierella hygrophila]